MLGNCCILNGYSRFAKYIVIVNSSLATRENKDLNTFRDFLRFVYTKTEEDRDYLKIDRRAEKHET